MDGGQPFQGGVALGLPLHVLRGDGVQGDVGDGVAVFVNHIGPGVLADLDGGDDVVQEGLRRHKVDHARDPALLRIYRRRHHDGELPRDLADQGLGDIDIPLHSLLDILPVGVILAVKNTDAVYANDVAPLEAVEADTLIDHSALFLQRHHGVGQLGDSARVHGHVLVGGELLLHPLRRQHGGLAHHGFHRGNGIPVIQRNAGRAHRRQGNQDCGYQAYCDLLADTLHLYAPQFFDN